MAAMPAISWTKSIRIHHESSGMQFGFFEVRDDSEAMPVKLVGHFEHVEPARVANERTLAPFVRDEVLLDDEDTPRTM
jgi:hypothetical protein